MQVPVHSEISSKYFGSHCMVSDAMTPPRLSVILDRSPEEVMMECRERLIRPFDGDDGLPPPSLPLLDSDSNSSFMSSEPSTGPTSSDTELRERDLELLMRRPRMLWPIRDLSYFRGIRSNPPGRP